MATGSLAATLPARPGKVMALTWCGADRLAAGGSDNTIRVWEPSTQREVARLAGHTGSVSTLVFHGGEGQLISGSYDTTVRLWAMGQ